MAVGTDTAEEEVDAAGFFYHLLIVTALFVKVLGVAVEDMDLVAGNVDMVEEVAGHERMVALGMALRQADILIHVEGDDVLERDTAFLVGFHQTGIHAFG